MNGNLPASGSILDAIGGTPLVRLRRLPDPLGSEVYLKAEGLNPSGSVKDRSALWMIDHAEATGRLVAGMTIIESSSGNLGIAIAQIAAIRGYRAIIVADAKAAPGQLALMRAYGAAVDLVSGDPPGGLQRARWHRVRELAALHAPAFIPDQYANPVNPRAHSESTGPEILHALGDELRVVVAPVSTGGHLSGMASFLGPLGVQIVAVDIDGSRLFRPDAHPYRTNGMGLSWVPENLATDRIDRVLITHDAGAFETARALARHEGIMAGPSTGAAVAAALRVAAARPGPGSVVVISPDRGDRYVDTLYDDAWCRTHGLRPDLSATQARAVIDTLVEVPRADWRAHHVSSALRPAQEPISCPTPHSSPTKERSPSSSCPSTRPRPSTISSDWRPEPRSGKTPVTAAPRTSPSTTGRSSTA